MLPLTQNPFKGFPWTSFHDLLGSGTRCLSLRDAFPIQNTILSAPQRAPAGRFSDSKYNFIRPKDPAGRISSPKYYLIRPKGPCGTTFCHSQNEIYDIGTEILCKTCFGHNSTQNERKSTIFGRIFTAFYVDSESAIKTRFKALFKNWPWIRCYRFLYYIIYNRLMSKHVIYTLGPKFCAKLVSAITRRRMNENLSLIHI